MKSLYTYYDYRKYISDYYHDKKSHNANYSFRYIAGKIGVDHALIVKIMQGERHISSRKIGDFAELLGLSERQTAYFRLLVAFSKSKNDEDSRHWFEKILEFSDIPEKKIDSNQYAFYRSWYIAAVREILNICTFNDDYRWLSGVVQPSISVVEAKKAVRLLLELGMIRRDAEGYVHLTDQFVTTGDNWHSFAIRAYQKEACTLAAQALDNIPKEERDISTVTLSLNDDGLRRISESLAAFRREIIDIAASCTSVNRAFQVNLQVFPVSARITPHQDQSNEVY